MCQYGSVTEPHHASLQFGEKHRPSRSVGHLGSSFLPFTSRSSLILISVGYDSRSRAGLNRVFRGIQAKRHRPGGRTAGLPGLHPDSDGGGKAHGSAIRLVRRERALFIGLITRHRGHLSQVCRHQPSYEALCLRSGGTNSAPGKRSAGSARLSTPHY